MAIGTLNTVAGSDLEHWISIEMPLPARQEASRRASPKRTFRRQALEKGLVQFCQLSAQTDGRPLTAAQYQALLGQSGEFITNPQFAEAGAERAILGDDFLSSCAPLPGQPERKRISLPPHLANLCEDALLTPEQEPQLFQRMNYLRYRAHQVLSQHDHQSVGQWDIERATGLLRAADWYRDTIVRANLRLVMSVVKKFANPQCSFDDLLSDGIMALIRAVDKFDYQLGFRFSTYATQVVRRNSYRFVMDRQEERFQVSNCISEQGLDLAEDVSESSMSEQRWQTLQLHLRRLLGRLDRREKFIIRARFSLGSHRRVQTLQKLADRLRISKERVRQLEKRAMEKLAAMAAENPLEIPDVEY